MAAPVDGNKYRGKTPSIEEMLAGIKAAGWKVSNLFELKEGSWQCNIRFEKAAGKPGESFGVHSEFCYGPTAAEAIFGVMQDMVAPRPDRKPPVKLAAVRKASTPKADPWSLDDVQTDEMDGF